MPTQPFDYKSWLDNFQPDPTSKFSNEQQKIIQFPGPYLVAMAPAGAGKTTTLTGMLDYQINKLNIDPKTVLAISFTRTAAATMTNKFPGIKGMTFDSFIADIFNDLVPNARSLVIADDTAIAAAMIRLENYGGFKDINNKQGIQAILQTVKGLAPKNRFQKIDITARTSDMVAAISKYTDVFHTMILRAGVISFNIRKAYVTSQATTQIPNKYNNIQEIIIDEAQDTNLSEYILILNMALSLKARIRIIGDSNQNISEWRGTSTEGLRQASQLEGFTILSLTENYRSIPEILHFANEMLKYTKTNEIADIQMSSPTNTSGIISTNTFKQHVHLHQAYGEPGKFNDTDNWLDTSYTFDAFNLDYLAERIKTAQQNNESFAVLARTNTIVNQIAMALRNRQVDVFTKPESKRSSDYKTNTTTKLIQSLSSAKKAPGILMNPIIIETALKSVVKTPQTQWMVNALIADYASILSRPDVKRLIANDRLHDVISLILWLETQIEARENARRTHLEDGDDNNVADQKWPVITIHASKGLEYDNLVIFDESLMTSRSKSNKQEELRLAYVASTRARKNLDIIQLITTARDGANILSNTMSSVETNPYAHAYALSLRTTFDQTNMHPKLEDEMPDFDTSYLTDI